MKTNFIKKLNNFPFLVFSIILLAGIIYFFSYLFPFTNNAFVVANIMPVAADVSGFITDIAVTNGQDVKKVRLYLRFIRNPIFKAMRRLRPIIRKRNLQLK